MKNLWKRLLGRRWTFLAVSTAVFAGFEFLICAVVAGIDLPALFAEVSKNFPPAMKGLIEQYIGGFGSADLLAFAWNHPVVLAAGGAVAIVLASHAVAGEIEEGTLELVLGQPVSRGRYFAAHAAFAAATLAVMSLAGVGAMILGQRVYHLRAVGAASIVLMAASFFLLQLTWFAVTLFLSAFGRTAGRVSFAGFLLALLSYLAHTVGQLWPRAAFLVRYSVNGYHDPRSIAKSGGIPAGSLVLFFLLIAVFLGLALWKFERRDIP